ncbi:MAG: MotA/TolQ/ExbB proton channel family protein [Bacteroidaceae bacterium]|nr:MotA/TolQ/ExbB proton channel family protein [Bacteroidaceae bacterium]
MKKVFAFVAMMGLLSFGVCQTINAQEEAAEAAATEEIAQDDSAAVDSAAAAVEEAVEEAAPAIEEETATEKQGLHKNIKVKFIEGNAGFMSLVAIAMILGLALCIERIIFLSLSEINSKKLLEDIQAALENGDVEGAKTICRETRGPVASICYQGLMRIDEGLDVVERSVVSYGSVCASNLEKNLSWITLFIAMSPSLGFLGTVIGMVQAFDDIQKAGDISPTVVAGGMKVALITTIFGIIVALVLQVFYNYILSKVEALNTDMEDASVSLLDIIMKYNLKFKK